MSAAFGTQAFQQSRHARRIYVGGFPPNYGDEEALKFFLNSVIAKGLGEPNDNSYVLSIYVNQKKCFAFVELRAIELATACLDLDGIIYKKVVLKVLRANEYKPELIPPSMVGAPITLDLSSFSFGVPASPSNDKIGSASIQSSLTGNSTHPAASGSNENQPDARLDSVIQFASLSYISAGCISIIGYPFDDRSAPNHNNSSSATKDGSMASGAHANALTSHSVTSANMNSSAPAATSGSGSGGYTGLGCTQAPKKMRNMIRKYKFGMLQNPEYDVDLKNLKFIDVGDVQAGKSREETKHNLSAIVAEVVQRRAVPFVVGGSSECAYYTTLGVISATARPVGMVVVSAQLEDLRVLEDPRLCERHSPKAAAARAHKQAQGPGQAPGTAVGIAESGAPGLVRAVSSHSQSLATTLPGDSSVASPVSTQETSQQQSQQSRSELDSPFGGMDRGGHCGGRYVRFAAQGLQCTTQQTENVTSKGGHVVWLGRDIRNQSTLCSLCPHLNSDQFAALAGRAVPHVYTLALFREALRCAAGKHAVPSAPTAGVVGVTADVSEKVEDEGLHPVYRAESRDFAADPSLESTPIEPSEKAPAVATETPSAAGLSDSAASAAPAEVEVVPGGVVVSIDMGVITGAVRGCGYITGSSNSTTGLTVDEILDMVMIAGADPNVLSLDISEFSPDAEDSRSSMLLAQMFYQFSLGVASRPASASSAAKSLGRAVHPTLPAEAAAGGAGGAGGAEAFMYGEDATAMRVPFRLTVHDRSSEQLLLRDLGSLSRTPKFYQEVSSGSMEAFTSTNNGQAQPATEKPPQLPYIEVDHRFSSMDCLDHTGISMPVPDASKGISASSHSVSSGSTNTNHSGAQNNNTNNITINTNHPNNTNTNNTTKPPASPNHYVASPPTASTNLTASSESFSKSLYPSGMPPQYVNHSQSQRAALQAADASGMFTGMVRTSPAGTPVAAIRRLGSASTASSPPLGHRGINTAKSVPGPGQQGMMGVTGLYPSAALPRTNSTGSHLTQHQQLYAQQQQQQQQQQALLQQQQLQQHHALYNQPPPPQQQRGNQPPPSYRSGPTPPASLQGPGQGQGQVHFGGSGAGAVPTAYAQQRARYEAEQTWGGDRVDPAGQNRYAQPAPSQRQQLMQAQHQQQQLYRLQQHQQQHQQQQQAHNQAPLDDRSSSPSPHLYLSPDFLDISGERHSNALSSPSNSGYGDRQGGSSLHRPTNSTGSDLSGALAGLGVGVGAGSVDLSKPKSSLLGGSSELSGFDETVEMYEYRMQQQQQAQAQQLRGRSLQPQGASQGLSSQGAQNSLSQSGLPRVGSALSYNTAAPMYSLYPADSMNFARSGSESLASNLTQDLMGSLSSSSSLLFTTSPHTPLTALGGGSSKANPSRMNSLSNTNNNNNNSSNNTIIDPEDTTGDFLQEHYNQFS